MIRTSQSLLANTLMTLIIGRDWRFDGEDRESKEYKDHCDIISWFADVPSAPFAIQNFVKFAHENCNKKPGEWFGPSSASQSIKGLCDANYKKVGLRCYLCSSSGDIYEDELLEEAEDESGLFHPTLILAGIRLGVKNVNPVYWDFLKKLLGLEQSVGITGGRPSSSHYFYGYQGNFLFYLDPHFPQKALVVNDKHENEIGFPYHPELTNEEVDTVHTTTVRRLYLDQMDPSMLVGLLVKDREAYSQVKKVISEFDVSKRFLNFNR
ncbi:unnamed protein product [Ambrosiozyma monospora]|uniref:Unnamed protein product n=1 Tax=Ambrosiozyma monospora TaxID=43982 RepID=A0ACB5U5J5_AMBMO|nr:unnamed protein product [Ambrosiozyma monospora]